MKKSDIKHHSHWFIYEIGEYGDHAGIGIPASIARLILRKMILVLFPAIVLIILAGCSGNSGSTDTSQVSVVIPTGKVMLTGRTKPVSTKLTPGTATPDSIAITIDDAAISEDGNSYINIISAPVVTNIDSQMQPTIGEKSDLFPGIYKSIKLSVSNVDWNVNWSFSKPSPCDSNTSGSAAGSLDKSDRPLLYFNTADLGGNTLLHYQSSGIVSGYAGDADHPFLLPVPIQVMQDETTTVNLVVGTENTLGCSHISVFNRTDGFPNPNVAPLNEIAGSATKLFGLTGLTVDPGQQQLIATNAVSSSITIYPTSSTNNAKPIRTVSGPDTRLNGPAAVAFYSSGQAGGSGDQYIVVNRDNNSIETYNATSADNAVPARTIWGLYAGLSEPTGIALNLDPIGDGDPNKDEILIANSGNDSITSYSRVGNGDTFPTVTLQGSLTQLDHPCRIEIDKSNHEVFVTNRNSNTITVYDLFDLDGSRKILDSTGAVLTSPHINIPPLLTIMSSAGFDEPCGIVIDNNNSEIIVANGGNDTVSFFDLGSVPTPEDLSLNPATAPLILTPKRSISGINTGLHEPIALLLNGGELWVAHNGGNTTMVQAPSIIPAITNEAAAANIKLNGEYNIVQYRIDLHKGTNGFGSKIPVIHSVRGKANFDAKNSPWPSFSFQVDTGVTQFERQLIEPSCTQPDLDLKNGFFGLAADDSFYAFSQNNPGMINGSFLPNGDSFAGVSYDGDDLYVIYGIKSANLTMPYFSDDGTNGGNPTNYATIDYMTYFQGIYRFLNPPADDQVQYLLDISDLYTDPLDFIFKITNSYRVRTQDPMGDYIAPESFPPSGPLANTTFSQHLSNPTTLHIGGLFENTAYGMAGALSKDGRSFIFMNDTHVDTNGCRVAGGIGVGLRQTSPGTFKTGDIKGTYFMAGIGDQYQPNERSKYFSMLGSISFDGAGTATLTQNKNTEGDITSTTTSYFYQVVSGNLPGADINGHINSNSVSTDILKLYPSLSSSSPYAIAAIGLDGQLLAFYETGGENRFLGYALLQKQ